MRYRIVNERAGDNYSAYAPDAPGCIATAPTLEAVRHTIGEAIDSHLVGLADDGEKVLMPSVTQPEAYDPFAAFTEWSGEIDEADYADL